MLLVRALGGDPSPVSSFGSSVLRISRRLCWHKGRTLHRCLAFLGFRTVHSRPIFVGLTVAGKTLS